MADNKTCYCSFCGKSQHQVFKLIAGVTAFICDECIDLCGGIIAEARIESGAALRHPALRARWANA